ncbi:NAC domain-containing protein [Phycomyces nitens]|nr:NAC domain-containing protein [Phycomyces nitens]
MSAPVEEKPVSVEETTQEVPLELEEDVIVDSPQSRGEKKARKAILGLGLKRVAGINRVTFTRARGIIYAIAKPEVYQSMNSDTFIVFGEMQVEDMAARAQAAAAEQLAAEAASGEVEAPAAVPAAAEVAEVEEEEEISAEGTDEKDIDLVITQANVSRNKAIKALKNNNNDIVNAIMELTM